MDHQKTGNTPKHFGEGVRPGKMIVAIYAALLTAFVGFVIWSEYEMRSFRLDRPPLSEPDHGHNPVPVPSPNAMHYTQRSNLMTEQSATDLTRSPEIAVAEIMESANAYAPASMVSKEIREQNYRTGIQAVEREMQKMNIRVESYDYQLQSWAMAENRPPNADGGVQVAPPEISELLHKRDDLRSQIAAWDHLLRQERVTMQIEFYGRRKENE